MQNMTYIIVQAREKMSKKVWFNWHCYHCEKRNRVNIPFQFEIPRSYTGTWECERCEKESLVKFDFTVSGAYPKGKPLEIKRRKKKEKVEKKDTGTKKDQGYCNRKI